MHISSGRRASSRARHEGVSCRPAASWLLLAACGHKPACTSMRPAISPKRPAVRFASSQDMRHSKTCRLHLYQAAVLQTGWNDLSCQMKTDSLLTISIVYRLQMVVSCLWHVVQSLLSDGHQIAFSEHGVSHQLQLCQLHPIRGRCQPHPIRGRCQPQQPQTSPLRIQWVHTYLLAARQVWTST